MKALIILALILSTGCASFLHYKNEDPSNPVTEGWNAGWQAGTQKK